MPIDKRPLKVFLCHASLDKPMVRELSQRLFSEGWIDPWLDEKKLLPGQDWRLKIEEAVETSDIVIICLSNNSVSKEGFVQKELRYAREIALEKLEESIFLIPLRLDDCTVPRGLRFYQWVDYFGEKKDEAYDALVESLKLRYDQKLRIEEEERARLEKVKREREAVEKIVREKAEREVAEKAAREKVDREAAEKVAREKAESEAAERVARTKVEREAVEKAAREKAERDAAEKAAREKAKREATEKAEREKAEKAAREKLEREAAEKARREKAEREAAERAAREKAKREAAEKAKRERAYRQDAQTAAVKETFSKFLDRLKLAVPKAKPFLRIGGIIGIIFVLFRVGSWAMPQLLSPMPTAKPSATITFIPTKSPTSIRTSTSAPTKTRTPTPTLTPIPQSSMLFQENFEDNEADWGGYTGDWVIKQEPNGNYYWSASGPSDYPQNFYLDPSTLSWTDYAFESRIQFVKGNVLWILIRADVGDNWYGVVLDNNYPIINYFQGNPANVEGKLTSFHTSPRQPFAYNKWYTIRIEVKGNNLKTYVDNVLDASLTLPSPLIKTSGGIGYFMDGGSEFYIDDIKVWSLK